MPMPLRDALRETLEGWQSDLEPAWQPVAQGVALGFDAVDPSLMLEPWEPIFPARRGKKFPGAPPGAHMLRAFDGIEPDAVRCVILGQDPYPSPDFATGRAFEAGNVARWRELEKMFSHSVRTFMQQVCAARTGRPELGVDVTGWSRMVDEIEAGQIVLEPPDALIDPWVRQGVLPLNSSCTLSRFAVAGDPHQVRGHLPVWRPWLLRVLRLLAERDDRPTVFIGFGRVAMDALGEAGIVDAAARRGSRIALIARDHPAAGNAVLALPNPFLLCNEMLRERSAPPIRW
jgi:uracil-DNA glycosylase